MNSQPSKQKWQKSLKTKTMNNSKKLFKATSLLVALVMLTSFLLTGCGSVNDRVAKEFTKVTNVKGVTTDSGLNYKDDLSFDEELYFYKGNLTQARAALERAFPRVKLNVSSKQQLVFESGKYFGILETGSYNGTAGSVLYYAIQDQAMNRHYTIFTPFFGTGWLRMGGNRNTTKTTTVNTGSFWGNVFSDDSEDESGTSVSSKSSNSVKGGSTGLGK